MEHGARKSTLPGIAQPHTLSGEVVFFIVPIIDQTFGSY